MAGLYWLSVALLIIGSVASQGCELIVNGGFEQPNTKAVQGTLITQEYVPGWRTTDPRKVMHLLNGHDWMALQGEGEQLLLTFNTSWVYQDIETVPGTTLTWKVQFAVSGSSYYHSDAGAVDMGPSDGALVRQSYGQGSLERWRVLNGTYVVPAGQTSTRFAMTSLVDQVLWDEVSVTAPSCPPTKFPPTTVPAWTSSTVHTKKKLDPSCFKEIQLVNPGFEEPKVTAGSSSQSFDQIPGWKGNGHWTVFTELDQDLPSHSGNQAAYLPKLREERGSMYQDFDTVPGSTLQWTLFAADHIGNRVEPVFGVDLGAPNGPAVRHEVKATYGWQKYTGEYKVPRGQTKTRLQVISISGGWIVPVDDIKISVVACDESDGIPTVAPPPPEENPDAMKCIKNLLQNGDFEAPVITIDGDYVYPAAAHWNSTGRRGLLHYLKNVGWVQAAKGNQLAYVAGRDSITQTIATNPGDVLYWSFHHRAAGSEDPSTVALILQSGRNSLQRVEVTDKEGIFYNKHSGRYAVPYGQQQVVFEIRSMVGASFIDDVQFGPAC